MVPQNSHATHKQNADSTKHLDNRENANNAMVNRGKLFQFHILCYPFILPSRGGLNPTPRHFIRFPRKFSVTYLYSLVEGDKLHAISSGFPGSSLLPIYTPRLRGIGPTIFHQVSLTILCYPFILPG